jgi:hypothetical protein
VLKHRKKYVRTSEPKTPYEIELLEFETMSGDYKTKLGIGKYDDRIVKVNGFNWEMGPIKRENSETIIKDFLTGLKWVHKYYYNEWNGKMSEWYYPHEHSPTITELYTFLKKNIKYLDGINLSKYEKKTWYTPTEQLLWITALSQENRFLFPNDENLEDKIKLMDNKLNKIAYVISKNKDSLTQNDIKLLKKHIDCEGVLFITKCRLNI